MTPETLINRIGNILPDFKEKFLNYVPIKDLPESVQKVIKESELQICIWDNKGIETSYTGSTFFKLIKSRNNGNEDLDDSDYKSKNRNSEDFYNEVVRTIQTKYQNAAYSKYKSEGELRNTGTDGFDSDYSVLWIIKFKSAPKLRERYVWQLLLNTLAEYVQNINHILDPDTLKMQDFNFMDKYQKYLFGQNAFLPESAVIEKLSVSPYERRQNKASVYFISKKQLDEIENNGKIAKISKVSLPGEGMICENNIKFVRKLLETCSNSSRCLLVEKKDKNSEICGILHNETILETMQDFFSLKFEGYGSWRLIYQDETILLYQEGTYFIDKDMKANNFREKLSHIPELKTNNTIELFVKILNKFEHLCHGGLMIIADDAETEAEFLCESACRGMKIEPLDLSDDDNLTLFFGMSSIDGATLVDFKGTCHGFGVILDGEAQVKGDMGSGARHNSASNYIFGKRRYAVIISEDKEKGITVLCQNEIKEKEIPINNRRNSKNSI